MGGQTDGRTDRQKPVNSLITLRDTANFRFLQSEWAHPFMTFITTPIKIFFNQVLISMNLYQHAKNQAFHLFVLEM